MTLRTVAAVAAIAFFAGCGGGTGSPPRPGPQNWDVGAGGSAQSEAVQALDFYPSSLTIDAGDTVIWTNSTTIPHTVSIPTAGQTPPPGAIQKPVGGSTFDGSTYISSGFLVKGQAYSLRFTTPGVYKYYCLVHPPEMLGTIVVQPPGSALPESQSQYQTAGQIDLAADLLAGATSIAAFPFAAGGTHVAAGIAPGLFGSPPAQSTVLRYLDGPNTNANVTVPVGTTLTWTNISNNVPHTVTFPVAGQGPPPGSPDLVPPSGGSTYDGSVLTNSGVMPPGKSYSLTFTKAGTFTYYCLFHDGPSGMIGTVTVQ